MGSGNPGKTNAWAYVFSGAQLAISVLIGVFGGLWLDRRWATTPWLTLVCSLLGIGLGLYQFIKEVSGMDGKSSPDNPKAM
ncbi:MAG: AtpZ/AtpI family protein [Elusimicrobia bacterium]|nr:AtpZ/AtpI family protein [Elusimicrobiota bacterium]